MLAMALFPEAQHRAQAQIDAVIGRERAPKFSDKDDLPYISALINETLRWRTVGPVSIPTRTTKASLLRYYPSLVDLHYVVQDDWYRGFLIPKASMVVCNVWSGFLLFNLC